MKLFGGTERGLPHHIAELPEIKEGSLAFEAELFTAEGDLNTNLIVGSGGTSNVVRGLLDGVPVAVKIAKEARFDMTLVREAVTTARLHEVDLVQGIYGVTRVNERRALVLELIDGETLLEAVNKDREIHSQRIFKMLKDVSQALAELHRRRPHGDLKPENIMIDSKGRVRFVDIPTPVLHASGERDSSCYSPPYTKSRRFGPENDLYALGVMTCEFLESTRPDQDQYTEVRMARWSDPLRVGVNGLLEGRVDASEAVSLFDKALDKERHRIVERERRRMPRIASVHTVVARPKKQGPRGGDVIGL